MDSYLGGTAQVIVVNLLYGLEVDHTLQFGLMFVCGEEEEEEEEGLVKHINTCVTWMM